jgi:hypothetical protein
MGNGSIYGGKSAIGTNAANVYVACANDATYSVISSARRNSGSGYLRILAWL